MSEHEKRFCTCDSNKVATTEGAHYADCPWLDVKRLLSSTRDAALEEAKGVLGAYRNEDDPEAQHLCAVIDEMAGDIRALQSAPAQVVSVAKVREVLPFLRTVCGLSEQEIEEVVQRLGLPLDAEGAEEKDTRKECTCLGTCRGADRLGAGWKCVLGRETSRETATVENGLLPAPQVCECGCPRIQHVASGGGCAMCGIIQCYGFRPRRGTSEGGVG